MTCYPPVSSSKTSVEIDDDVASETNNPVEEISDDEEETNSPHKINEERTRKRHRESTDESESVEKEAPSITPFVLLKVWRC